MESNVDTKALCIALMKVEKEDDVIKLLTDAGYWDDEKFWRYYGDYENNYNTIGNQQSSPDAALVEKLVNAVDARLMNECLAMGVDPAGPDAPKSIQKAVAQFFEGDTNLERATAGLIREWGNSKRTEVARDITMSVTGLKPDQGDPCFTIADAGEGQTPNLMPETFLSLTKNNKLRIPFVQGKFNMGGTGVLKFCGEYGLQLILSRRNPKILANSENNPVSDSQWGFTVVRRENPTGNRRSSIYTYLAPIGADENPGQGGVLRFPSDKMPIFPIGQNAYVRESSFGTLIKLYEYSTKSRTHMFRKGGIQRPLDLLLSNLALPIRLHECRDYKGHKGSFEITLTGVRVRLEDDKAENLEFSPSSAPFRVAGETMIATIYAFKKDKDTTYRSNEGIIFTINGQTHGHFTKDFFRRKKVGLSYVRDSVFVIVDCSQLSGRAREDLFMNSRDRLSDVDLRTKIEAELEYLMKKHQGLRDLTERRRREELASKLDDSKPLEDILEDLLKMSSTLSDLFLVGKRIPTPFKTKEVQGQDTTYEGKKYPSYFKFKDHDYGFELKKECPINSHNRIIFETDVVNDYFSRDIDRGEFTLDQVWNEKKVEVEDYSESLHNGICTLTLWLPNNCQANDVLHFCASIQDDTQLEPYINNFTVTVMEGKKTSPTKKTKKRKPPWRQAWERERITVGDNLAKDYSSK